MSKKRLRIDIVSDLVCPWCVIGFLRLSKALEKLSDRLWPDLHWHAFELNPNLPEGGQDLKEYFALKYGMSEDQTLALSRKLSKLGSELGFDFNNYAQMRIYNTFKAHQLLTWAKDLARQTELERELFAAYFTEQKAVDRTDVLLDAASRAGLDPGKAKYVLKSGSYADAAKRNAVFWASRGIHAVPAFILDDRSLISGAQEIDSLKAQILGLQQGA